MKILLLNPHIDAQHSLLKAFQKQGVAVLLPHDSTEAWQMLQLHGSSVELAIFHREGADAKNNPKNSDSGIKLLAKIKQDPAQADLPVIVTSETWQDSDFAAHQKTPAGANAYLKYPFSDPELIALIDGVLGSSLSGGTPLQLNDDPSERTATRTMAVGVSLDSSAGFTLEDHSGLLNRSEKHEKEKSSISLDAPDGSASEPPAMLDATPAAVTPEDMSAKDAGSLRIALPPIDPASSVLPLTPPSMHEPMPEAQETPDTSALESPIHLNTQQLQEGLPTDSTQEIRGKPLQDLAAVSQEQEQTQEESRAPGYDIGQDYEVQQEMPYLFGEARKKIPSPAGESAAPAFTHSQPVGDAVVPGGAAHAPDVETLKKYLLLREQDVAALSAQLKAVKDQLSSVEDTLRLERARNVECAHIIDEQRRKIADFDKDKEVELSSLQNEINELRFEMKSKADRARLLEAKVKDATEEMERLKERVRIDIRKIRVREKELENRLEIMRKDSEALISARENKIIELKRKLDLLEFNMDLLQDQYGREKENSAVLREKLSKAAQVVRVAGGLLDASESDKNGKEQSNPDQSASLKDNKGQAAS